MRGYLYTSPPLALLLFYVHITRNSGVGTTFSASHRSISVRVHIILGLQKHTQTILHTTHVHKGVQWLGVAQRAYENPDGPFPKRYVTRCRRMWAGILNDPGIEFRTNCRDMLQWRPFRFTRVTVDK